MLFSVNIAKVLSLLCRSESIVGTPPLLKEVYNLSKIKSLGGGGVQNILLERGNKPEKRKEFL